SAPPHRQGNEGSSAHLPDINRVKQGAFHCFALCFQSLESWSACVRETACPPGRPGSLVHPDADARVLVVDLDQALACGQHRQHVPELERAALVVAAVLAAFVLAPMVAALPVDG